MNITNKRYLMQ